MENHVRSISREIMAKKRRKSPVRKNPRVNKILEQAKEPFSLLETLKEEGMARAMYLLSVASFAAKNVNKDKLVENLKEAVHSLGLVTHAELHSLEERIEQLEERLSEFVPHVRDEE